VWARSAFIIDADEQLECSRLLGIFWRSRDGVRPTSFHTGDSDEDRLSCSVVEGVTVEVEPNDPRARGCADHVPDRQREEHGRLCYRMLRRFRGRVLRLVRRRPLAIVVGLALTIPAAWVEFSGRFDAWWMDGIALVVGATGLALAWTGITGAAPDWID
jgi:hypothetical protein